MNIKSILAFSIGPIGGAAIGLITVPIITWYFSPSDIGKIALFHVLSNFSILFFSLGLDQAYVREYHECINKPALFKMSLLPGLTLLIITISLISFLDLTLISKIIFNINSSFLSLLVIACILSLFITRFLSLILRMQENGLAFSMSQILPKIIFLIIIIGYVELSYDANISSLLIAYASSIISVGLIYSWNTRKEWNLGFRQKFDLIKLKSMLHFGTPLIISGVAYWGLTAMDKLFLRSFSNFEELGIYSVSTSFAGVALVFQSIFSTIWAPIIYKWVADNKNLDKLEKITDHVLMFSLLILSLAGMFSWIILYILPDNYSQVQYLLVICMIPPIFYTISETTVIGINITRRSGYAMLATILAAFINLVGNYFLIPSMGATGAAISTAIAFWFFIFFRTEFSSYLWRPIRRKKIYTLTLLFLVLVVTFQVENHYHYLIWSFFIIIILYYFYKNKIIYQYLK